jgi:FYVE zinc finger
MQKLTSSTHTLSHPAYAHPRSLYLQRNHIATLPEGLSHLRALRRLFLDRNELRALPAAIGRLVSLEWLSLDDNELSTLPVELIDCENLEWVSVERNHLVSLPDDLASMAFRLRFFSVIGNQRLISLPLSMSLLCEQVTAHQLHETEQHQMLRGRTIPTTPTSPTTSSSSSFFASSSTSTSSFSSLSMSSSFVGGGGPPKNGLEFRIDSVLQIPKSMTHGYPLSDSAMDLHNYQNEHQDRVRDIVFYLERVVLPLNIEFNGVAHYPPQSEVSSLVRCPRSGSKFTFKNTRTHCRLCGNVYAKREVQHRVVLAILGESRVCHYCFEVCFA